MLTNDIFSKITHKYQYSGFSKVVFDKLLTLLFYYQLFDKYCQIDHFGNVLKNF